MFGLIDAKVYAFLSVVTALLLFAIYWFDKNQVVVKFLERFSQGSGLGTAVANFVTVPIKFAVSGPAGAILGGLLWPLLLFWLLLLVFFLGFTFIAPGVFKASCSIDARC